LSGGVLTNTKPFKPIMMINPILLDERFDLGIIESLMYEDFDGKIKDSGKSGDKRIYGELKAIEKEFGIKL
jgi:hypothetical protein